MAKSATETPGANLWHFQIKDQQGDRNGKDAIAKCFQAVRFHLLSLPSDALTSLGHFSRVT